MRGREQHVERKIRLWVVQQERNRLRERQPASTDAMSAKGAQGGRPDARAPLAERLRFS